MVCVVPGVGSTVRFTKTNGCCAPMPGPCNAVVTNGFASIEFSTNTEETEALTKTLADGSICINRPARNRFSNFEITIDTCPLNTDAFEIMTGTPPILGHDGEVIGWRFNERFLDLSGWALEVWITEESGTQCDPSGQGRYIYMLVPCLQSAVMGDFTIESGSTIDFTFSATSRAGQAWCRGPWNVVEQFEGDLVGGPLIDPLMPGDHGIGLVTSIPPPPSDCACIAVPDVDLGCSSPGESPAA